MATSETRPAQQKRFNVKYLCKYCNQTWKVRNTSHLRMICKTQDCSSRKLFYPVTIRAYSFEVIDKLVIYRCPSCKNEIKEKKCSSEIDDDIPYCKICQEEMEVYKCKDLWVKKRKFGSFYCDECKRSWKSGNSWEGVGQKCQKCNTMILPHTLTPLLPPRDFDPYDPTVRQPHQQHLCDMCKKLGYNCQGHVPEENVADEDEIPDDDDDDLSVLSTNSSVLGPESEATDEGDRTPINSDDDDEEFDDVNVENIQDLIRNIKISK